MSVFNKIVSVIKYCNQIIRSLLFGSEKSFWSHDGHFLHFSTLSAPCVLLLTLR